MYEHTIKRFRVFQGPGYAGYDEVSLFNGHTLHIRIDVDLDVEADGCLVTAMAEVWTPGGWAMVGVLNPCELATSEQHAWLGGDKLTADQGSFKCDRDSLLGFCEVVLPRS
jgi:hypothetical protein